MTNFRYVKAAIVGLLGLPGAGLAQYSDQAASYRMLDEINKASLVMLVEKGIVPPKLGASIATAIITVNGQVEAAPEKKSGDYLQIEPLLIAAGGADVSRLHSGRSRQDIGATMLRLAQRDQLLSTFERLTSAREKLIAFAEKNANGIIPAYTWGVQAQPISMGHYILGYTEALETVAIRFRTAYESINRSPLGSAALGTSSFPVDRTRLAGLLGFDRPLTNSFYANQLSPIDTGVDLTSVSVSTALVVGTLVADIQAQYRAPAPWLTIREGDLTGVSSIMPQKRNPVALQALRLGASEILGGAMGYYVNAHNVSAGMGDYKGPAPQQNLQATATLLDSLSSLVDQLDYSPERSVSEVNADYSTTTELAEILQREKNVPFRVGHHFASELVSFGRQRGLKPSQIQYRDAQALFTTAAHESGVNEVRLPLSEGEFRRALSAENMITSSKGLGGPQPDEVRRMIEAQRAKLVLDQTWQKQVTARLQEAGNERNRKFSEFLSVKN